MVLFAAAAMELLRAAELSDREGGRSALLRGTALAVAAALYKTSTAVFVLGGLTYMIVK